MAIRRKEAKQKQQRVKWEKCFILTCQIIFVSTLTV